MLGFIPVIGAIVGLIAAIWGIVCAIKAIKHALEMSTGRAIATGILAAIVAGLVLAIIGGIFGVTLLAFAYQLVNPIQEAGQSDRSDCPRFLLCRSIPDANRCLLYCQQVHLDN